MSTAETQLLAFEKGSTAPDDFPDALEAAVRKCAHLFGFAHADTPQRPVIGKRPLPAL